LRVRKMKVRLMQLVREAGEIKEILYDVPIAMGFAGVAIAIEDDSGEVYSFRISDEDGLIDIEGVTALVEFLQHVFDGT